MKNKKTLIKILLPVLLVVCIAICAAIAMTARPNESDNTTPSTQGMNGSQIPNVTVDPTPSLPTEGENEAVYSGQVISLEIAPIEEDANRDALMVTKAEYRMIVNTAKAEDGTWSNPIYVSYTTNMNGSFGVCPGDTLYFSAKDAGNYDLNGTSIKAVEVKEMSRINDKALENGSTRGIYADGYMDKDTSTGKEDYYVYLMNYNMELVNVVVNYTCYQGEKIVGEGSGTVKLSGGSYPNICKAECNKEYDSVQYTVEYTMSADKDEVGQRIVRESKEVDGDYVRVNLVNGDSERDATANCYVVFMKDGKVLDIVLANNNDWTGILKAGQKQYLYAYYPKDYYDDYMVCYDCKFAA